MPRLSHKLAESLAALHAVQARDIVAIRAADLTRTHRERLLKAGFLQPVIKGWYIAAAPDQSPGESSAWYACYWHFCAAYLRQRFSDDWCLSPEQSIALHTGNWSVPRQLLVRTAGNARNNVTVLPHGTSLLDIRTALPDAADITEIDALRLYTLPAALIACGPRIFTQHPTDMRAALSMLRDASEVLAGLLQGGHSTIAGRLAGALRNIGRSRIADDILAAMQAAGHAVREADPFTEPLELTLPAREVSPYVNRLRLMWQAMRAHIPEHFPAAPGLPGDKASYLQHVDDIYVSDAYHSLSIEGYRVSPQLIERVRSGGWNPDANDTDREQRSALAARGYWQAHQLVKQSIAKVLDGANPGTIADADHGAWYRELFAPGVTAGLIRPADLAGYRNGPVYIRGSRHVPLRADAVREVMPVLFELLHAESEPSVRAVLGHFTFVYIHPYMDGNGRMGRLLMNVMLAAGGYPWTVIPVEQRATYMAALEAASVEQNIHPFTKFLAGLLCPASEKVQTR